MAALFIRTLKLSDTNFFNEKNGRKKEKEKNKEKMNGEKKRERESKTKMLNVKQWQ